jgi:hypothetical protein
VEKAEGGRTTDEFEKEAIVFENGRIGDCCEEEVFLEGEEEEEGFEGGSEVTHKRVERAWALTTGEEAAEDIEGIRRRS